MSKDARVKVKSVHRYNVVAGRIYDTLLDIRKAKNFMFRTVTGKLVKAELEPWVGGHFVIVEQREGHKAEHYGEFTDLVRPRLIVFRFSVQKDATESDMVTIELKTLQQGTQVTLTHEIKPEFKHLRERIQEGWDGILDGLGEALRA